MIVHFTETEYEWIVKEPFNWHIKEGCPEHIRESLERKLDLFKADNYSPTSPRRK